MKRSNDAADRYDRRGDAKRAARFVAVTIGALVVGYLVFVFLYVTVVPMIVGR